MFQGYLKLLEKAVSFKSVSTDPKFQSEIGKIVTWLKNLLINNNFKVKVWTSKESNPVIFASYTTSPKAETVLIYGHYDVQPANNSKDWFNDPFKLVKRSGKLYARGVLDNKGQILIHMASVLELIKTKKLKYNVKFLIEGNEETGNPTLSGLMQKNKKDLKCDLVLISDGELTNNRPTVEISLRGGFNCTLTYKTSNTNVHSGIFGGAIPSASTELTKFLGNLYTKDNKVNFNDFYVGVDKITDSEVKNNKDLSKQLTNITKLAGVQTLLTEPNTDFYTQTGLRPTIQITGINSGYIDVGYANIVPAKAEARLNFRLVASQNPKKIADNFKDYVKKQTPKYVDWTLEFDGLHSPIKINTSNKFVGMAEGLLSRVYGTKVARKNVGGAIPFVADVKNILGVDALLIPFGNEDCNMHGTNENFDIDLVKNGLSFSNLFLSK